MPFTVSPCHGHISKHVRVSRPPTPHSAAKSLTRSRVNLFAPSSFVDHPVTGLTKPLCVARYSNFAELFSLGWEGGRGRESGRKIYAGRAVVACTCLDRKLRHRSDADKASAKRLLPPAPLNLEQDNTRRNEYCISRRRYV